MREVYFYFFQCLFLTFLYVTMIIKNNNNKHHNTKNTRNSNGKYYKVEIKSLHH